LFCLALTVPLAVFAPEKSQLTEDQGKIEALEAVCNRAGQSKDITYIDSDGSLRNREQFLAHVWKPILTPTTKEVATRAFGDCVVVTGVYRDRGTKNGEPPFSSGRSTDTWAKIDGNWQCVARQATGNAH